MGQHQRQGGASVKLSIRIRRSRLRAGLTQKMLACALGVSRGAVANWEGINEVVPAAAHLIALADATGVAYEWLATGRGSMAVVAGEQEVAAVEGQWVFMLDECQLLTAYRRLGKKERRDLLGSLETSDA